MGGLPPHSFGVLRRADGKARWSTLSSSPWTTRIAGLVLGRQVRGSEGGNGSNPWFSPGCA